MPWFQSPLVPTLVGLVGAVGLVATGCGPSFQALYEGDARFEHCYALEETGPISMTQKSECWRDWILRYTYGQTRDRVEYAAARYRALSRAPQAPTDEAMMEAAPNEGRASSIAAPAPTSAFAPPPKTLADQQDGGAPQRNVLPGYADAGATTATTVTEENTPQPPGAACTTSCDATWNRCKDQKGKCGDAGATTSAACEACTRDYKKCMRTCFAK